METEIVEHAWRLTAWVISCSLYGISLSDASTCSSVMIYTRQRSCIFTGKWDWQDRATDLPVAVFIGLDCMNKKKVVLYHDLFSNNSKMYGLSEYSAPPLSVFLLLIAYLESPQLLAGG